MFADTFSAVSIHCVARGLGSSFLYNLCPAPHRAVVAYDSTAFLFSITLQSSHFLFGDGDVTMSTINCLVREDQLLTTISHRMPTASVRNPTPLSEQYLKSMKKADNSLVNHPAVKNRL